MVDSLDNYVRRRVADALRNAGFSEGQIGVEVLYMMPKEFVRAYEELYMKALNMNKAAGRASSGSVDAGRIPEKGNKSQGGAGGLNTRVGRAVSGGSGGGKRWVGPGRDAMIGDEHALELKAKVDRKLKGP